MKIFQRLVFFQGAMALLAMGILASNVRAQNAVLFTVLANPTNNQAFTAPANLYVHAQFTDTNPVQTVQYFSGNNLIGVATTTAKVIETNLMQGNPLPITWSNVLAGAYTLTAVVFDRAGNVATSAPVNITVTNPVLHPSVYIYSPTNNSTFLFPANLTVYARAVETGGTVATVQVFANGTPLGVVSNSMVFTNISTEPLYPVAWTNVPAGSYALKAVATDALGNSSTSSVVNVTVLPNAPPPPPVPFAVSFWYPTNGQSFLAPANVGVHALATDSNVVRTMHYFANGASIGIVTNITSVLLTNITQGSPFFLDWSNVPTGSYALTAVATDNQGYTATSPVVNITVTNVPPPVSKPAAYIYSPTNGESYVTPATVNLYAHAYESPGQIATVQFFANSVSLGVVSNASQVIVPAISTAYLFPLTWSNAPAGAYALQVVATDTNGYTATSSVVNITINTNVPPPNIPFATGFWYPTNGQFFLAPANVGVHAWVTDSNVVQTVHYFANGNSIGAVTNISSVMLTNTSAGNPFFLDWSNVPTGSYALTAVATDSAGNNATSAPVNIFVLASLPPVITIYATDPVAVVGTNSLNIYYPTTTATNYISGGNTATFVVHRNASTNTVTVVYYAVSGTASNGVDYQALPGSITIPAGTSYALITIYPLNADSSYPYYDTVVLSLIPSQAATNLPPAYTIGSPSSAGAIILNDNYLPIPQPLIRSLSDNSLHLSLPATNGMNFALQSSTDLVNWMTICTRAC